MSHLGHEANIKDLLFFRAWYWSNNTPSYKKTAAVHGASSATMWDFKENLQVPHASRKSVINKKLKKIKKTWCVWQPVHFFGEKPTNIGGLLIKDSPKLLMYDSKRCCQGMM